MFYSDPKFITQSNEMSRALRIKQRNGSNKNHLLNKNVNSDTFVGRKIRSRRARNLASLLNRISRTDKRMINCFKLFFILLYRNIQSIKIHISHFPSCPDNIPVRIARVVCVWKCVAISQFLSGFGYWKNQHKPVKIVADRRTVNDKTTDGLEAPLPPPPDCVVE